MDAGAHLLSAAEAKPSAPSRPAPAALDAACSGSAACHQQAMLGAVPFCSGCSSSAAQARASVPRTPSKHSRHVFVRKVAHLSKHVASTRVLGTAGRPQRMERIVAKLTCAHGCWVCIAHAVDQTRGCGSSGAESAATLGCLQPGHLQRSACREPALCVA